MSQGCLTFGSSRTSLLGALGSAVGLQGTIIRPIIILYTEAVKVVVCNWPLLFPERGRVPNADSCNIITKCNFEEQMLGRGAGLSTS